MTSSSVRRVLIAGLLASAGACAADLHLFEAVEPHMGTLVRIKLYAAGPDRAQTGFRAAFDRIAELDDTLSDYKPESELNRVCRTANGRPVTVSADLFRVLDASQKLAEETGGAFDVTLGPVIRLWRQARKENRLPAESALHEAAARCGFRKLHLDPEARTVSLDQAGMQLDLGAIGKGYTADAALAALRKLGIGSAMIAMSGDLAIGDPPPGQPGWRIGIDSLDRPESNFTRVLNLCNAAVSTSGDTEQKLDLAGKRYSHIIDPATDMGITHAISVTIVARYGIDSDGLSTAVSVLGVDRGLALVGKHAGVAALLTMGRDRAVRVLESPRWRGLGCQPVVRPQH